MSGKRKIIAVSAIVMIAVLATGVYAALYGSVHTTAFSVIAKSEQLDMFITNPYCWYCYKGDHGEIGPQPSALAAGHCYTLFLGVANTLECETTTYMKYIWDASITADPSKDVDFEEGWIACWVDVNINPDTPDSYGWNVIWYLADVDGDTYWELTMWCDGDPYHMPANTWFITQVWFKLAEDIPSLHAIQFTMEEHNEPIPTPAGTILLGCCGLPYSGMDLDYQTQTGNTWPGYYP